jgi:hypothetical protein
MAEVEHAVQRARHVKLTHNHKIGDPLRIALFELVHYIQILAFDASLFNDKTSN